MRHPRLYISTLLGLLLVTMAASAADFSGFSYSAPIFLGSYEGVDLGSYEVVMQFAPTDPSVRPVAFPSTRVVPEYDLGRDHAYLCVSELSSTIGTLRVR